MSGPSYHAQTHEPGGTDELTGFLTAAEAVTSLSKPGGTLLHGDVTLTGGLNVDLTEVAQDILIDAQIETFIATTSTDNPALGGATPLLDDGGINYRGWIWAGESGGATVLRRDFGTFDGTVVLPIAADDAAIVLDDGLYLIVATALVTFPAQAPARQGLFTLYPSSAGLTFLVPGAGKRYLEMGNSTDRVESFQATALVSVVGAGRLITPTFYEDDAGSARTGSTLSSARTLDFAVAKLRTGI